MFEVGFFYAKARDAFAYQRKKFHGICPIWVLLLAVRKRDRDDKARRETPAIQTTVTEGYGSCPST